MSWAVSKLGELRSTIDALTRICSKARWRFMYETIGVSSETYSVEGLPVTWTCVFIVGKITSYGRNELICSVHPCHVKIAALHSEPNRYVVPSPSSAPNTSAHPFNNWYASCCHTKSTVCRKVKYLDCKCRSLVKLKSILCLWVQNPFSCRVFAWRAWHYSLRFLGAKELMVMGPRLR